jgi:RimJ/RimL family protein N-acetyltransferase
MAAPIDPVELTAGPLLLRPWREDDVDAYVAAVQDPTMRLWNGPYPESREELAAIVARRRDWSSGEHASWAVVDAGTGELLGSVSLHRIDRSQADAEVGYWTAAAARGRGVAGAAVEAACRWGFTALALHRVQLYHAVENTASQRVAEKAGFTREGRLRQSHRYGDGRHHDELLWGRLADDPAPPSS